MFHPFSERVVALLPQLLGIVMNALNTPTPYQIDEFVNQLKAHDWFYEFSDDHSVWISGRKSANKLSAKALSHGVYDSIYRNWADTVFNRANYQDVVAHRNAFIEEVKAAVRSTVH